MLEEAPGIDLIDPPSKQPLRTVLAPYSPPENKNI